MNTKMIVVAKIVPGEKAAPPTEDPQEWREGSFNGDAFNGGQYDKEWPWKKPTCTPTVSTVEDFTVYRVNDGKARDLARMGDASNGLNKA